MINVAGICDPTSCGVSSSVTSLMCSNMHISSPLCTGFGIGVTDMYVRLYLLANSPSSLIKIIHSDLSFNYISVLPSGAFSSFTSLLNL